MLFKDKVRSATLLSTSKTDQNNYSSDLSGNPVAQGLPLVFLLCHSKARPNLNVNKPKTILGTSRTGNNTLLGFALLFVETRILNYLKDGMGLDMK